MDKIIFVAGKARDEELARERSEQAETLHACRTRGRAKNSADIVATLRDIKENGAKRFKGSLVDSYSASAFLAVYDKLNDTNKVKLLAVAEKSLVKAVSICFQLCK